MFSIRNRRILFSHFKLWRFFLLLCAAMIASILGLFAYLQFYLKCSEAKSVRQIKTLCSQYHNKEIVGSMCSKLCDENNFVSSQCDGNRWGKNVQILTCKGCTTPGTHTSVVMKALFDMDIWDSGVRVSFSPEMTVEEKVEVALREIRNHSTRYFDTDFADHPDLISYFLGMDYRQAIKDLDTPNAVDVVLRTTISLAVQWEYLSMKVLGNKRFLPKIYGTCGQAYFVEYTPSLGKFNHVLFQGKAPDILNPTKYMPSWHERVDVALKLLKLIVDIEDTYSRPLHMCDIQIHNYGVSGNEIVLMDSDSVRFETINLDKNCFLEGCRYLTCIGVCGKNNTCAEEMVSNNLQTVCKAIFISRAETLGLLRGPPPEVKDQLRQLLHECAYPKNGIFRIPVQNKSDRKILQTLEELLHYSLTV